MNRLFDSSILVLLLLSVCTTSVSGMGFFTTLMAHIQEQADKELFRMRDNASQSSSGGQTFFSSAGVSSTRQRTRYTAFPSGTNGKSKSSIHRKADEERMKQRKQRQQKSHSGYLPFYETVVTRAYGSREEELIERLVELQQ
mmetsp:Transcript_22905/g.54067  ORF Transcript_22905/g.54067 Transcript_22905/m.54067 type:complete len:142 (-) Transcript_22905:35-460(-)|eukprot:CAMPEP_0172390400 /NCGR_PEP_ID=MMETSP1061-20121228/7043_1 /TAXON_ID=37318 /ORGANISM="Pseudo-nitzschia pungens, Strain cf. pungens" /LENGTH=141 /DNA_ID=CAMNT_0013120759 /DNA_START=143 /DNA_END=568 /DNA_ORIENTATION=+